MAQRQFRSDDTSKWIWGFGDRKDGDTTITTSTEAPVDASCSGTISTTTLTATNASFAGGKIIGIFQMRGTSVGAWEFNKIESYNAGTVTLKHPLMNTYTDSGASQAYVRVFAQYKNATVSGSNTLTSKAWTGDVGGIAGFFAENVTLTGTISGNGAGFIAGDSPSNANGYAAEGSAGATVQQRTANGNGGGGGLKTTDGYGGGGGGHANGGNNGGTGVAPNSEGLGGGSVGSAGLTTLFMGGGGGSGGTTVTPSGTNGNGGNGGGIVIIVCKTLTITGGITVNGNNGVTGGAQIIGGGGAGAGGSVLLKCRVATLGTNLITATGGTGGAAGSNSTQGGNASVGRIHLDYSLSYTGTTNPTLDARQDNTIKDQPKGGSFLMFV